MIDAGQKIEDVDEIVNNMINNIENIVPSINDKQILEMALYITFEVRNAIPMYIGNLNPKWELWEDVRLNIQNRQIQLREK
jgi:hypothetical protein